MRGRLAWIGIGLGCLAAGGCREDPPPPPAPPPVRSAPVVDKLAPGELAEGPLAFGIPLPRGMKIKNNGHDRIMAVGHLKFEQVASYLRDHLKAERIETGPAKTIFTGVKSTDGDKERDLRVEVADAGSGIQTRIDVYDVSPLEVPDEYKELSETERWKRVGLTPDGKPVDPDKFE